MPERNDPCPCNSGKKYTQCCLGKDEEAARVEREKARAAAAEVAAKEPAKEEAEDERQHPGGKRRHDRDAGHFAGRGANQRGFQKTTSAPRKVGGG